MLKIMENKTESILSEDQYGFRKNKREIILALRTIIEKNIEEYHVWNICDK